MNVQKIKQNSAALYSYSAVDFNSDFLKIMSIEDLIDIILLNEDERAVFRAAWALEHLLLKDAVLLTQHENKTFEMYNTSDNWSALRSLTKIILAIFKNKPSLIDSEEELAGIILDKSFRLLVDTECPIAVRCNLWDIIFALANTNKWILEELKAQIQLDLEKNATPALLSRGNKIFKKIAKVK